MNTTQKGFIAPLLLAIIALFLIGGGVYVYDRAVNFKNSGLYDPASPTMQAQTTQTSNSQTSDWKTFVNSRDGYSIKYSEDADSPSIDYLSELKSYGFETSLTFLRYGGWADIYIFNGRLDDAITAYSNVDSGNRVYSSTEDTIIDGKSGKVVHWTNRLDPSSHIESAYFVEYRPTKTLLIEGSQEFLTTIKFL